MKAKTTATKEEAKPPLVPKLRFPEFRDAETWKATPLGELGAIVTGKTPSTKEEHLWGGEILFITPTDITEGEKYQHTTQRTVIETKGTKVLPAGSVVYTCIASIGKMALTVVPSVTNQQINAVVPNSKTAREFIYYSLENLTPWIKSIPATSTLPIINKTQFSGFNIPHPEDKAEQQKIAECLSSVDELMAAQARKVDALKTHKKGLMQQLFPREDETQPRLRFPEFQNAGEWDSKPLGELGEIITGKTPSTKEADLWGGDILFITPTDISEDSKYQHNASRTVVETKGTKVLPVGSIVYTCIASIGKMALTVSPSITNQQINAVVPNKRVFGEFLYYALANLTPWIKTLPATNTLPIINKTDFSKIAILHPANKDEQQRIATCLSSLDALITAETQKHEALKTHKKGLMQQLFPSPEEVEA